MLQLYQILGMVMGDPSKIKINADRPPKLQLEFWYIHVNQEKNLNYNEELIQAHNIFDSNVAMPRIKLS